MTSTTDAPRCTQMALFAFLQLCASAPLRLCVFHYLPAMDVSKIEFPDKEVTTDVVSGDTYEADLLAKVSFKQQIDIDI